MVKKVNNTIGPWAPPFWRHLLLGLSLYSLLTFHSTQAQKYTYEILAEEFTFYDLLFQAGENAEITTVFTKTDSGIAGPVVSRYENGDTAIFRRYRKNTPVGPYNIYYPNGAPMLSLNFVDTVMANENDWFRDPAFYPYRLQGYSHLRFDFGYPEGWVREWDSLGHPSFEIYYEKGKRAGGYTRWWYFRPEMGEVKKEVGSYKNHQKHGLWTYRDREDRMTHTENYLLDQLDGFTTHYFPDGKKSLEGNWASGQKHGMEKTYYPEGNLKSSGWYKRGERDSLWQTWFTNNNPQSEERYNWGTKTGKYRKWYENGQLMIQGNFKTDQFEGTWEEWYPNGQLAHQAFFEKGQEEGTETWWTEDGAKALVIENKAGDQINTEWLIEGWERPPVNWYSEYLPAEEEDPDPNAFIWVEKQPVCVNWDSESKKIPCWLRAKKRKNLRVEVQVSKLGNVMDVVILSKISRRKKAKTKAALEKTAWTPAIFEGRPAIDRMTLRIYPKR